jgi:hypothetical protein
MKMMMNVVSLVLLLASVLLAVVIAANGQAAAGTINKQKHYTYT